MASRKEYEMLFQLNAQLGGSYNSTFSKAQQQVAAMQKEIQALSKTQADISAFQKQQSAVEATKKKLETLQQQYDNIQKEIKETEGYSSSLENKLLSKQQQIDKTSASLGQQTQKLQQLDAALREAGVDTGHLSKESERLGTQMADLKTKQEQAAESAQGFGDVSVQAFGAIQQAIVAAGIAKALQEIYQAYMECVTIAGDFEAAMSNVEALSGATSEEMARLTAEAKELGATTKFTAQESADAMGYMAMAGWDVNDMLAGMDGVLQLAAASGEDLAMVSDIVTDSLSAFGLTAADTAHFSDVLAAAATNSNTNVSIMGETFKMSASIAGALGYSIEDVAVAVGLMANSGVKGSIAGTALRNTFNGLLEGVTLTGNAFGEYEYSAVKADGTMKDFGSTIDELRGYFDQMTEAERVNNAMTIAGARGYNGLLAILNATDEDYSSLTASINSCTGAASKMAAVKLDNMNGELVLMNSAWDALKTNLGEQFTPVMRDLYSVGTVVFQGLNKFVAEHPALVKAVAAFVAVIGTATVGLAAYAAIVKIVAALNLASLFAVAGPILLAVGVVAALTAGLVALANAGSEEEKELRSLTAASREQHTQLQELTAQYEAAKEQYGETSDEALALRYEVDQLTSSYAANKQTLEDFIAENDALIESHNKVMASFSETTASIGDEEQGTLALALKLKELTSKTTLTENEQKQLLAVVDALNQSVPDLALNFDTATNSLNMTADAVKAAIRAQAQQEREAEKYRTWVELTKEELALEEQLAEATENLRLRKEELTAQGYNTNAPLIGWSTDLDDYQDEMERLTTAYNENQAALFELDQMQEEVTDGSSPELTAAIESTTEQMVALAAAYEEAYSAAYTSVSGQYALWDEAADVVATSASSINSALESQVEYWQNYNTNLQSLQDRTSDIAGLSDVIASFADGSADSVNAVAGMASATDEELAAMVANWQTLQEEQAAASGSIADLKTDFTATMDELQQELAADIEAMDLGSEAAESGKATIQGFINGAASMQSQVEAAYSHIAQAAINAIDAKLEIHSPSRVMMDKAEMTWAGYIQETQAMEPEVAAAMADAAGAGTDAISTEETQLAILAPQLLAAMSNFGAASATPAEPMGGGGEDTIILTVSPVYTITGVANAADLDTILKEHDADLRDFILEVLEEAGIDAARRAYT